MRISESIARFIQERLEEMDGTAEIITKEMRLIEHFIQPVRALYDKNAE